MLLNLNSIELAPFPSTKASVGVELAAIFINPFFSPEDIFLMMF